MGWARAHCSPVHIHAQSEMDLTAKRVRLSSRSDAGSESRKPITIYSVSFDTYKRVDCY